MWWRNRKETWPPGSTQLGSLRAFAHSSRAALAGLSGASLQPAAAALDYFSGHPSWLSGAHPDHLRRVRRSRD